jgi:hypothetical protein
MSSSPESQEQGVPEPVAAGMWTTAHVAQRAQLLLRLLGVYFVIDGARLVLGYGMEIGYLWWLASTERWGEMPCSFRETAWFCSGALLLAAGLYLVIDGRWVLEKVFLPAPPRPADDLEDENPDEDPYDAHAAD